MKKILIFFITICIVVIVFVGLKIQYNRYNISLFEPFSENNSLFKIETNIKIENNLPKIESASAFHPYYSKMHKNQGVKIINVNNKSIKENDYPLLFNVYFIYRKNNKNDNIYKILEWLKTEQGKDFIKQINSK